MSVGRSVIVGLSLGLLVFQSVCWSGLSIWGVDRSIGLSVCLLVLSVSLSVYLQLGLVGRTFDLSVCLSVWSTVWLICWSFSLPLGLVYQSVGLSVFQSSCWSGQSVFRETCWSGLLVFCYWSDHQVQGTPPPQSLVVHEFLVILLKGGLPPLPLCGPTTKHKLFFRLP